MPADIEICSPLTRSRQIRYRMWVKQLFVSGAGGVVRSSKSNSKLRLHLHPSGKQHANNYSCVHPAGLIIAGCVSYGSYFNFVRPILPECSNRIQQYVGSLGFSCSLSLMVVCSHYCYCGRCCCGSCRIDDFHCNISHSHVTISNYSLYTVAHCNTTHLPTMKGCMQQLEKYNKRTIH